MTAEPASLEAWWKLGGAQVPLNGLNIVFVGQASSGLGKPDHHNCRQPIYYATLKSLNLTSFSISRRQDCTRRHWGHLRGSSAASTTNIHAVNHPGK